MISILPEHAPPSSDDETLQLVIANTHVATFKERDADRLVDNYAQDIVDDILSMHAKGFGNLITYESLQCSLEFIYIEQLNTEVHEKYTNILHNLINHKYTLLFT